MRKLPDTIFDPQLAASRYLAVLPYDLKAKFRQSLLDPKLMSLEEDVALLDARLQQHLEMLTGDEGNDFRVWNFV